MTWDKTLFPNPEKLQTDIASRGRKMVTIVDPHIKRDSAYPIFKNAEEKGYYVKNKDGKDYDGYVIRLAQLARLAGKACCPCGITNVAHLPHDLDPPSRPCWEKSVSQSSRSRDGAQGSQKSHGRITRSYAFTGIQYFSGQNICS